MLVPSRGWATIPVPPVRDFAREEMRLWDLHHRSLQTDILFRSKIAVDLAGWRRFEGAVRSFTDTLLAGGMMSAEGLAREAYLSMPTYGGGDGGDAALRRNFVGYRDAAQFFSRIARSSYAAPPLRAAASAVISTLNSATLASSQGSSRGAMFGQGGLQISLPLPILYDTSYYNMYRSRAADWAIATRWAEVFSATAPSGPWPTISRSLINGTDPTAARLPRVQFSAAGSIVEAEVRVAQSDPSFVGTGGRWLNYGPLLQGPLEPGVTYSATWNGRIRALPTPSGGVQAITTDWYIRAFAPGSAVVSGMMATPGVCEDDYGLIACDLVFQADTGSVDVVVLWYDGEWPSAIAYSELARTGRANFTPFVRAESNASRRLDSVRGTTITLVPGLAVRFAAVNSGLYEMQTHVTDVYGRLSVVRDYVHASAPFSP